ncbi:ABC transporter ATP-binding protein [Nanoarchaeota archaeon]
MSIKIKNLRKSYQGKEALKGISFEIKKGEIFGLLGPNGAGKSTTINIVAGLLKENSGTVEILGKQADEIKEKMNIATAYSRLNGTLTVEQNLRVYAKLYGVKNAKKKINELMESFEISHLRKKRAYTLSSGENTRLILCKAFINDPEVLLMDECTVGLDPYMAQKTRDIIKEVHKKTKNTILFTSHIMKEVDELCDRIAFLSKGKILKMGTSTEIKKLIKKQIIKIKLKTPKKNFKEFFEKLNVNIISVKRNSIKFELDYKEHKLAEILKKIFEAGFKVSDITVNKPRLEQVFIKIAKGEL